MDDEPELLETYQDFFIDLKDFLFISAINPREALIKLRNQKFNVICTDFRMPQMSGSDFITEIRRVPGYESLPMVVITGHVEEAVSACKGLTDILFLAKPVNLESVAKLAAHIAQTGKLPAKNMGDLE